jgi:hypothetical protein
MYFLIAFCWNFNTHRYLGSLLNGTSVGNLFKNVSESSILADKLKYTKEFYWTRNLHYNSIQVQNSTNLDLVCVSGCLYRSLKGDYNTELGWFKKYFMLHGIQDILQPFHNYGWYRGGNDYVIKNLDTMSTTTMHKFWDTNVGNILSKYFLPETGCKSYNYTLQNLSLTRYSIADKFIEKYGSQFSFKNAIQHLHDTNFFLDTLCIYKYLALYVEF